MTRWIKAKVGCYWYCYGASICTINDGVHRYYRLSDMKGTTIGAYATLEQAKRAWLDYA